MKKNIVLFVLITLISCSVWGQISSAQIDQLAERALQSFNVPGIAVAVIKDGKVIHSKGYGVKSIITKEKVDGNTLFGIASNSKAFTTAAIAMLVEEGKLKWDDKVIQYLPNFKMYHDYVTQEFTIRDLVTHRSGLGLGAGDLMIWPDGSDFTANDIIENLQYLKPVSSFRTKFDYDNLLYIVAGEVIHKVSQLTWAEFVEQRIMKPLNMTQSVASYKRLTDFSNVITPHVPVKGVLKVIEPYKNPLFDGAAGIYSSTNDLSKWVVMQLNKGKFGPNNQSLFSEAQQNEMWQLQTIIPTTSRPPYHSQFYGYGLGWFITDVKGYKQVSHTGGLEGNVTQVTLIPELQLGIIVLTNQQEGAAFTAITNTIKDSYLGLPEQDYITLYQQRIQNNVAKDDSTTQAVWNTVAQLQKNKSKIAWQNYVGTYKDAWFGEITLTEKKGKLYFQSKRSPQLAGEVFQYKPGNLVVKWNNAYFNADAHLFITNDASGKAIGIKMQPISALTDFSYDFQDLDFIRVN